MIKSTIKCNMALEMLNLLNVGRRLGGGVDNDFIKEMQVKFEANVVKVKDEDPTAYPDLHTRYTNFLKITGNERINNGYK